MRKFFSKLHLWLSVPFGIVITLICFSGAMLVFEQEIVGLTHADLYKVERPSPDAKPLPLEQLAATVAATLPDDVTISGIAVSANPEDAYRVTLSKPKRAAVYVNQYTGEVKGRYERTPFFRTMFSLHRWLLGSRPEGDGIFWGKLVVGISTLLFVVVLLSGIVIWWPRTKKALTTRLKITVRKGWRRFWYDLHVAGGMYVLLFLLAMALTGLTWSFDWYRTGFYKVFGAEMQQQGQQQRQQEGGNRRQGDGQQGGHASRGGEHRESGKPATAYVHWQQVLETLQSRNPDYELITVSRGSATVAFSRLGNQRASDRYTFNPRSGEITGTTFYKDAAASGKIRGWIYSVHVGSFGGWFTRILWFLAALMGATLPLTGYYLWIKRINRKH